MSVVWSLNTLLSSVPLIHWAPEYNSVSSYKLVNCMTRLITVDLFLMWGSGVLTKRFWKIFAALALLNSMLQNVCSVLLYRHKTSTIQMIIWQFLKIKNDTNIQLILQNNTLSDTSNPKMLATFTKYLHFQSSIIHIFKAQSISGTH